MRIWDHQQETGIDAPFTVTVTGPDGLETVVTGPSRLEAICALLTLIGDDSQDTIRQAGEILNDAIIAYHETDHMATIRQHREVDGHTCPGCGEPETSHGPDDRDADGLCTRYLG